MFCSLTVIYDNVDERKRYSTIKDPPYPLASNVLSTKTHTSLKVILLLPGKPA